MLIVAAVPLVMAPMVSAVFLMAAGWSSAAHSLAGVYSSAASNKIAVPGPLSKVGPRFVHSDRMDVLRVD